MSILTLNGINPGCVGSNVVDFKYFTSDFTGEDGKKTSLFLVEGEAKPQCFL